MFQLFFSYPLTPARLSGFVHVRRHFVNVSSAKPSEEQRGGRSLRGNRLLWLCCDDEVSLTLSLPPSGRLGRRGREAASPLLLPCHPVSPLKEKRSQLACAEAEERQQTSTLKAVCKKTPKTLGCVVTASSGYLHRSGIINPQPCRLSCGSASPTLRWIPVWPTTRRC